MEITAKQLKEKIANGEKLLIDFYGKFCGPCKVMKPWFESATEDNKSTDSNVELYTFDIDNDRDFVVSELGIRSVPTIKGFNDGKEIYHNVGVLRKEQIMEVINEIK